MTAAAAAARAEAAEAVAVARAATMEAEAHAVARQGVQAALDALREEHRLKSAEWAQLEERFAAATAERLREAAEWTARLAHAELADERSRALSAELRVTRRHAEGSAAEAARNKTQQFHN